MEYADLLKTGLFVFLISSGISIIGTWATLKQSRDKHEKRLNEGAKKFETLFETISEKVVKKGELSDETKRTLREMEQSIEHVTDMCKEKHGTCSQNVKEKLSDLYNYNDKLSKKIDIKVSESTKCINEVKQTMIKLSSDFSSFKELVEGRLNAHDRALEHIYKILNDINLTISKVPDSIQESFRKSLLSVIQGIKNNNIENDDNIKI